MDVKFRLLCRDRRRHDIFQRGQSVCRSSCNLTHPAFKQLQHHRSHNQTHRSEAARTFSRTYNDASQCGTRRDPNMRFGEGATLSLTLRAHDNLRQYHNSLPIFCDNPTTHCRYFATIPQLTADILRQSHNSLPISCDNPTTHCRYSATIPQLTADILRQSHNSLPIFCDNPTTRCRYSATIPQLTAYILRQSFSDSSCFVYDINFQFPANCNSSFRLRS